MMKRKFAGKAGFFLFLFMLAGLAGSFVYPRPARAGVCSEDQKRVMAEHGLSAEQIARACEAAGQGGGTDHPGMGLARKGLEEIFRTREIKVFAGETTAAGWAPLPLGDMARIVSAEKTNGMPDGDGKYLVEIQGETELSRTLYFNSYPLADHQIQIHRVREFDLVTRKTLTAGTRLPFTASIRYRPSEKGWIPEDYRVAIQELPVFSTFEEDASFFSGNPVMKGMMETLNNLMRAQ